MNKHINKQSKEKRQQKEKKRNEYFIKKAKGEINIKKPMKLSDYLYTN